MPSTARHAEALQHHSRHYLVVERAIDWLRDHAQEQPSLQALSQAVGMSPHHLQRVFSQWAGISPKRFLQHLSRAAVRERLRAQDGVLAAAHAAGLSGGGRVHDLMIHCEAATPGEVRSGGAGLLIHAGVGPSPFGSALVAWTARGICHLEFLDGTETALLRRVQEAWPAALLRPDDQGAVSLLRRVFQQVPQPGRLHLLLRGTNFQIKVWEALVQCPPGRLMTYEQLGRQAGAPGAARAVGGAMAANTIAWLIPCHRVIRASGDTGSYRWGASRKQAMLGWEAAMSHAPSRMDRTTDAMEGGLASNRRASAAGEA